MNPQYHELAAVIWYESKKSDPISPNASLLFKIKPTLEKGISIINWFSRIKSNNNDTFHFYVLGTFIHYLKSHLSHLIIIVYAKKFLH